MRIQRTGLRYKTGKLTIVWLPATSGRTRIGVTVSKKVGNSPTRSRVKRWIREVFRTHKDAWPTGTEFVVIARPGLARAGFARVERDMLRWAAGQEAKRKPDGSAGPGEEVAR